MVRLGAFLVFMILHSSIVSAQDTSCGIVWYPPIQISPGIAGVDESVPSIAVQGDTVHITWAFTSQKAPYRRSVDGGRTFEPVRELAPDSSVETYKCFVEATPTAVYGFWVTLPQEIGYVVHSSDRGVTWSQPKVVATSLGDWPSHASIQDTAAVILSRYSAPRQLAHSTDHGGTWNVVGADIIGNDPKIAMTPGAVHMVRGWVFDSAGVWSEFVAQYRKSTDLGETWSDSVNLSSMNTTAYDATIAADGLGDSAMAFAAWRDTKYGCRTIVGCGVLGRRSVTSGNTFLPEDRFDEVPSGYSPVTAVHGTMMAVAWKDDLPGGGGLVRVSMQGGSTWCPPYRVGEGYITALAVTETSIHVAWFELIGGSTGHFRVFYRRGVLLPTSVKEEPRIPPAFTSLSQNYPNPFNP
jgi:hypothetical protein